MPSKQQRRGIAGSAVVCLMLLLWLATAALAAIPQLHLLVHENAKTPEHNCLVSQLNDRPLLAGFTVVVAPVPPSVSFWLISSPDSEYHFTSDHRLPPGRAPPASSSPIVVAG